MFRVDVYPAGLEASTPRPEASIYTCFQSPGGLILKAGRKEGDVSFPKDKSVSREHCSLRLVSLHDTECPPRDEACRNSACGMYLVVEGLAKMGTFLVIEPSRSAQSRQNVASDYVTVDESGASQISSLPGENGLVSTLSPIARKLSSPQASLQRIGPRESTLLPIFSTSILQLGSFGSTLVVSPIKYRVLRVTNGARKNRPPLWTQASAMGIEDVEELCKKPTHIVAKSRHTSKTQVGAWAMGIPFVTNEFWEALWNRKTPTDPLPQECDFQPKSDKSSFWDSPGNPLLWSKSVFFSLKDDDTIDVALGGGARVVRLFEDEDGGFLRAEEMLRDASIRSASFLTEARSKIAKRLMSLGVAKVKPSDLVQLLIAQQPIAVDDRVVEGDLPTTLQVSPTAAASATIALAKVVGNVNVENGNGSPREGGSVSPEMKTQPVTNQKESSSKRRGTPLEKIEDGRKKPRKENTKLKSKAHGATVEHSMHGLGGEEDVTASTAKEQGGDSTSHARNENDSNDINKTLRIGTQKRKPVGAMKPGWLAPISESQVTNKFARSQEETMDAPEIENVMAKAITRICSNMVVYISDTKRQRSTPTTPMSGQTDFKRFRKNQVPTKCNQRLVSLKTVSASETNQSEESLGQVKALQEQQRKADELFRDPTKASKVRRRVR